MTVGQMVQVRAIARMSDGTCLDISDFAAWYSDNADVLSVVGPGILKAKGAGNGSVRVIYARTTGTIRVTVKVSVGGGGAPPPATPPSEPPPSNPPTEPTPPPQPPPPPPSNPTIVSLSVSGPSTCRVGASVTLQATAHMSDGSSKNVTADASWSGGGAAASVSQNLVKGLLPGSVNVTATFGGKSASHVVVITVS